MDGAISGIRDQAMVDSNLIKVRLAVDPDSWHGATSEGIWTRLIKPLSGKAIVIVDNIPFFTKSLSFQDKISVVPFKDEIVFEAVVERGGHSTYRVFIQDPDQSSLEGLQGLKKFGCDWELTQFNGGNLYAIDIPPQADIYEAYALLLKGQLDGTWLFEEGYVGHRLREDPAARLS